MRRRAILAGLAAAATTTGLGGCSRIPSAESDEFAVADRFDGDPARPECTVESETVEVDIGDETREYETAETIPYPGPPDAFDEEGIADYVSAFEEAYVTHRVLCDRGGSGHVLRVSYSPDRIETFDRAGNGANVSLRYVGGATAGVDDGGMWEADLGFSAAVYAVDDTGAARVAADESRDPPRAEIESDMPDPVTEGEFVARFGH